MSERTEKLIRERTLEQHRDVISREIRFRGNVQDCLEIICEAITDLGVAVAVLIDAERGRGWPNAKSDLDPSHLLNKKGNAKLSKRNDTRKKVRRMR